MLNYRHGSADVLQPILSDDRDGRTSSALVSAVRLLCDLEKKDGRPHSFQVNALKNWKEYGDDPLIWSESENAVPAIRFHVFWSCLHACHEWSHARLVVGPDLVSEWRAKHGKK